MVGGCKSVEVILEERPMSEVVNRVNNVDRTN